MTRKNMNNLFEGFSTCLQMSQTTLSFASLFLVSGRNFSLFKFQLLTSQDSHVHSLSHGNPITSLTPLYFYPLTIHTSRRTRTRIERFSTRLWYSRVVRRQRQQTSVTTRYKTLGILNRGDQWRLPPHLQGPSQAGASSGRNPPDDKSNA